MRISNFVAAALVACQTSAFAVPQHDDVLLVEREEYDFVEKSFAERAYEVASELYKRKGGGGGGGKGGGSSSSGSSSSSSSSSSAGKGGSSGSSSSSSSSRGSSSSSAGGATKSGSGASKIGGGKYYGGGASTPYTSGGKSPSGISPLAVGVGVGAGVGIGAVALSSYHGSWPYGLYSYPYYHPYTYYNRTGKRNKTATSTSASATATPTVTPRNLYERQDDGTGVNETKLIDCVCAVYAVCGCDDSGNSTFLETIIGDGTNLNASLVTISIINNTETFVINGTLPNGTTSADPSATDDATSGATSSTSSPTSLGRVLASTGYLFMVALVGCTVFLS